jgi:hypothetical protein
MPRTIAPEIIRRALPIFTNFLIRDDFDEELAIEEFARIAPNPSTGGFLTADEYVMVRRAGSAFVMNRASRLSVYASFENALNHAAVEIEVA